MGYAERTVQSLYSRVLALVLALTPARALAAGNDDAETLITEGLSLRKAGKDDEALRRFQQAYALVASPRTRAQIALAEQALGQWSNAESDLEAALAAETDPWIVKNRAALEAALAVVRRHVGRLEVRSERGAEIFVDGTRLGELPAEAPFRLEAGSHTLEVRAPGFIPVSRTIDVVAGALTRESVSLVRRPVAPEPAIVPASAASQTLPTTPASAATASRERGPNALAWTLTIAGGALLGTGGVARWQRERSVSAYNNDPSCGGVGSAFQSTDCASKIDAEQTWNTISIVSFVAGGILAAGGVLLLLTSPRASSGSNGTSVSSQCSPSVAGLTCSGRF